MVRMQKTTESTRKPRTRKTTPARGTVKKTIIDLKEEGQEPQLDPTQQLDQSEQPDQSEKPIPSEQPDPEQSKPSELPKKEAVEEKHPNLSNQPKDTASETREEKIKRLQYNVYHRGGYVKQQAKKELRYMGAGW